VAQEDEDDWLIPPQVTEPHAGASVILDDQALELPGVQRGVGPLRCLHALEHRSDDTAPGAAPSPQPAQGGAASEYIPGRGSMVQGTSASARKEPPGGHVVTPPADLRGAIDQVRAHATALREALAGVRSGQAVPRPNGVAPVSADLVDQLDAGISRVRAEIASLQAQVAGPREPVPEDRDEACMVALNMALNGASRTETDRYLDESFGIRDRQRIVDDAYERVQRLRGGPQTPYDWQGG
jgi:hypothetical protein